MQIQINCTHTDGGNVPTWAGPVTGGVSAGGAGTSFLQQRYFQFITLNNSSSQPEKEQRAPSLFTLSVTLSSQEVPVKWRAVFLLSLIYQLCQTK